MERRIQRIAATLGGGHNDGPLVLIAPNSWSDDDRDAWERAEILHDAAAQDDLIERNTGVRPTRRPGLVSAVIVPAPQAIEEADEATRAAWREQASARHSWRA